MNSLYEKLGYGSMILKNTISRAASGIEFMQEIRLFRETTRLPYELFYGILNYCFNYSFYYER